MTGASPNTEWLRNCVCLDDKGFVLTGPNLTESASEGRTLASLAQTLPV
jgi:thioredoxin reductase (NADPH)